MPRFSLRAFMIFPDHPDFTRDVLCESLFRGFLGFALKTYAGSMRARILPLLVLLLLAGCSSVPSVLYKIEIQQGNVITQDMVDKLKPGMSRSQVRFALGSPLISDPFHDNRWDYVYRLEQKGRLVEQRKLTVFFEGDNLVRIDGTFSPSIAFAPAPPAEPASPAEEFRSVAREGGGVSSPIASESERAAPGLASTAPQAPVLPQAPTVGPSEMPGSGQMPMQTAVLPQPAAGPGSVAKGESSASALAAVRSAHASARSARQVPSQALDTGEEEADQPKE
jgi:outer membrane protein assembly factor BamE